MEWLKTILDWLDRNIRPAWLRVAIILIGAGAFVLFKIWGALPASAKPEITDRFFPPPAEVRVATFAMQPGPSEELKWLRAKVERNLVQMLEEQGHKTAHDLSSGA